MRAINYFRWVNPSVIIKSPDTRASPETTTKCLFIFINTKFFNNKILDFHLKKFHLTPVNLGAKHLNWTKPAIPSYILCPTGLCTTGFYKSWKAQWKTRANQWTVLAGVGQKHVPVSEIIFTAALQNTCGLVTTPRKKLRVCF